MIRYLVALLIAAGLAPALYAASPANDTATDPVYQPPFSSWANGDNGGFGFGPWFGLVDHYIGNSDANGDGSNSQGSAPGMDIDTPADAPLTATGASWALRGDGATGGIGEAFRPFSSSLQVGERLRVDFDNGFVTAGDSVGFGLQTTAGVNLFEFYFTGGNTSYTVAGSTLQSTTQTFTDDGMRTYFTLIGPSSFSFMIDFLGTGTGPDETFTGTLAGAGTIDRLRLFNFSATGDPSGNAFYNNLEVIPEPSTYLAAVLAMGACVYFRRRHTRKV